ncbi:hypothetical protein F5Y10DRAFT_258075 [Nemania abortiva]|nr:hypothetical protein F5Y10DRAFT_258075 [Nemania abortiva]
MEHFYTTEDHYDTRPSFEPQSDLRNVRSPSNTSRPEFSSQQENVISQHRPDKPPDYVSSSVSAHSPIENGSQEYTPLSSPHSRVWKSGFWARFPFWGVMALLGAVGTTIGIAAILESSDGKVIGTWAGGIQPNTFIAIGAILSNILLVFAFSRGLVVSYWRRCLHGTTFEDLHKSWEAGQSMPSAWKGIIKGYGRINALALITLTLSTVRSPLNQAAAGVSNSTISHSGMLDLQIASKIPEGYTGIVAPSDDLRTSYTLALTQAFSDIVREYSSGTSISLQHDDCGDICNTAVNTFGFCATCISSTASIWPERDTRGGGSLQLFSIAPDLWIQGDIYTTVEPVTPIYAGLILQVLYVSDAQNDGRSTRVNKTCHLQPSIMTTKVNLTGGSEIKLLGDWKADTCASPLNYTIPGGVRNGSYTTVDAFRYVINDMYTSEATFTSGSSTSSIEVDGVIANQYITNGTGNIASGGPITWADPTDDILNTLRELSFRASVSAARDVASEPDLAKTEGIIAKQTVPFVGISTKPIYKTDRRYVIAGFVVSILGVVGVALLFNGWWELGRKASMSPIEIALAFDAPLLQGVDSNAEAKDIVRQAGKSRIRYGDVFDRVGDDGETRLPRRLRFEDARMVERPKDGETY